MNRLTLAICDSDKTYCHRLDEYLHGKLKLGFEIMSFTEVSFLIDHAKDKSISLLVISEKMYRELIGQNDVAFKNVLVLEDGHEGHLSTKEFPNDYAIKRVNRLQPASVIINTIIDFCLTKPEEFAAVNCKAKTENGRVLGFFSPLRRCGQTSFATTAAKILADKGKVIFISFESFSDLAYRIGADIEEDITDILYYAECERQKMHIYLEKIKKTKDGIDYILPARTASQIRDISYSKIKELVEILVQEAGYDYVVLDLTEYPEGFWDIVMMCDKVFTVTKNNPSDAFMLRMYDEVLIESGYEEIKTKTVKCQLPDIRNKEPFEKYVSDILGKEGF